MTMQSQSGRPSGGIWLLLAGFAAAALLTLGAAVVTSMWQDPGGRELHREAPVAQR
jgi:hypothetical protein